MSSKVEKRRKCWDNQYTTLIEKDTNSEQKPANFTLYQLGVQNKLSTPMDVYLDLVSSYQMYKNNKKIIPIKLTQEEGRQRRNKIDRLEKTIPLPSEINLQNTSIPESKKSIKIFEPKRCW